MSATDACFVAAGNVGKAWKACRRDLPRDAKDLMAELLLCLRLHILPLEQLDSLNNVGRARFDIRGIAELLNAVATRYDVAPPPPPEVDVVVQPILAHDLEAFRSSIFASGHIEANLEDMVFTLGYDDIDEVQEVPEIVSMDVQDLQEPEPLQSGSGVAPEDPREDSIDSLTFAAESGERDLQSGVVHDTLLSVRRTVSFGGVDVHEFDVDEAIWDDVDSCGDEFLDDDPGYLEYIQSGGCYDPTAGEIINEDEYV